MELLKPLRAPLEIAKFVGQRLVGGAWADLQGKVNEIADSNLEYMQLEMQKENERHAA